MSYSKRAARRDEAEPAIVEALRAAGASVTVIGMGDGVPDLLVGHRGATYLLEVKSPLGPRGGNPGRGTGAARISAGGDGTLSRDQLDWWSAWRGAPPVIVRTPAEALVAIGAPASELATAPAAPPVESVSRRRGGRR